MRHIYQTPKAPAHGINLCEGCLEKQLEIDRLREENERLKAQLRRRARAAQEGFFGASTPSAQMPVKANSPPEQQRRQGGAKEGHPGHGRRAHHPTQADAVQEVWASKVCPHCQMRLRHKGWRERSVIDLEAIRVKRILYRLEKKQCPACGQGVAAQAPGVLPKALLGNQLLAEIADTHYLQGMPLSRVCARYELKIGTVMEALHRVGRLFAPALKQLITEYRQARVRHADETTWRTDGENGYCWLFASERVSLYLYRQTRAAKVVAEVFGREPLAGYLVVDRYRAYARVPCLVQYCYAHLLRDLKDELLSFPDEAEVQSVIGELRGWLAEAMRLTGKKLSDRQYYRHARKIRSEIAQLCQLPARHLAVRRWQDFFVEEAAKLYHWVSDRAVPCENNRAERELRPTVIARKVSFGSQAEEGARTRQSWMSVLHSLKKRGIRPQQRVKEVLDQLVINPEMDLVKVLLNPDSS